MHTGVVFGQVKLGLVILIEPPINGSTFVRSNSRNDVRIFDCHVGRNPPLEVAIAIATADRTFGKRQGEAVPTLSITLNTELYAGVDALVDDCYRGGEQICAGMIDAARDHEGKSEGSGESFGLHGFAIEGGAHGRV